MAQSMLHPLPRILLAGLLFWPALQAARAENLQGRPLPSLPDHLLTTLVEDPGSDRLLQAVGAESLRSRPAPCPFSSASWPCQEPNRLDNAGSRVPVELQLLQWRLDSFPSATLLPGPQQSQ